MTTNPNPGSEENRADDAPAIKVAGVRADGGLFRLNIARADHIDVADRTMVFDARRTLRLVAATVYPQAAGTVITTSELLVGGDLADEGTGVFDLSGANVVGDAAALAEMGF